MITAVSVSLVSSLLICLGIRWTLHCQRLLLYTLIYLLIIIYLWKISETFARCLKKSYKLKSIVLYLFITNEICHFTRSDSSSRRDAVTYTSYRKRTKRSWYERNTIRNAVRFNRKINGRNFVVSARICFTMILPHDLPLQAGVTSRSRFCQPLSLEETHFRTETAVSLRKRRTCSVRRSDDTGARRWRKRRKRSGAAMNVRTAWRARIDC